MRVAKSITNLTRGGVTIAGQTIRAGETRDDVAIPESDRMLAAHLGAQNVAVKWQASSSKGGKSKSPSSDSANPPE